MSVLFALSADTTVALMGLPDDQAMGDFVVDEIVDVWDETWLCETEDAAEAIDCAMTSEDESDPLFNTIYGSRIVCETDEIVVSFKDAKQVGEIARALAGVTKEEFRQRYFKIDPLDYSLEISEEDFDYAWDKFQRLPPFYAKAAQANRTVIFVEEIPDFEGADEMTDEDSNSHS